MEGARAAARDFDSEQVRTVFVFVLFCDPWMALIVRRDGRLAPSRSATEFPEVFENKSSYQYESSASDDISYYRCVLHWPREVLHTSVIFTSDIRDVDIRGSPHTLFLHIISVILSPKHPPTRRNKYYLAGSLDIK